MPKPLADQVVVVTGASQGIGRATALEFARRGARVVAAARNQEALQALVADIEADGGTAEAVVADVADYDQVAWIGNRALERFGAIDTWVNNAAVLVYATLEQLSADELDRIIHVNLLGQMYGSKVAVASMRPDGGTIVNVGSALSERAVPLQSAYVASKHGVAGFSEALRLELAHVGAGIDVVLVMPSSTDTPLFAWARSKLGVQPRPIPPVYASSAVAMAICHAAEHGGREIVVGGWGKLLTLAQSISPSLLDRYMLQGGRAFRAQRTQLPDDRRDNLFEPSTGRGATKGAFGSDAKVRSVYTDLFELHPMRKRAVTLGAVIAGIAVLRRLGR